MIFKNKDGIKLKDIQEAQDETLLECYLDDEIRTFYATPWSLFTDQNGYLAMDAQRKSKTFRSIPGGTASAKIVVGRKELNITLKSDQDLDRISEGDEKTDPIKVTSFSFEGNIHSYVMGNDRSKSKIDDWLDEDLLDDDIDDIWLP